MLSNLCIVAFAEILQHTFIETLPTDYAILLNPVLVVHIYIYTVCMYVCIYIYIYIYI